MLRRAEHVVVVTESFRKRVIEKGTAPERVDVVSNGVDLSLYYASDEAPPIPALRRGEGELIVGYLGNFGASQDLASVLDAVALLEAARPARPRGDGGGGNAGGQRAGAGAGAGIDADEHPSPHPQGRNARLLQRLRRVPGAAGRAFPSCRKPSPPRSSR